MGSLRFRNGKYYGRFYVDGQQFERNLNTANKAEAVKRLDIIERNITRRSDVELRTPFERVFDLYFQRVEIDYHHKPSVIAERSKRAKVLLERFLGVPIGDIDDNAILAFQRDMQRQYSSETIRKVFLVAKRFFRWCADQEIIFRDPTASIKIIKERRKPIRVLTFDEIKFFLDCADKYYPQLQGYYTFLFLSMARLSEVLSLKWQDYYSSYDPPAVRVVESKTTSGRRLIPLSPIMQSVVSNIERESEYIFTNPVKNDKFTIDQIVKYSRRLYNRCNIPDATTHTLRHTAATYWLQIHGDIYRLSRLLGHSTVSTTEIYLHIADVEQKMSIDSLDEIFKK